MTDQFHRPGEPDIIDIPLNDANLTTVEAEYDRAMKQELIADLKKRGVNMDAYWDVIRRLNNAREYRAGIWETLGTMYQTPTLDKQINDLEAELTRVRGY